MSEWEPRSRRGQGRAGPYEGVPPHLALSLEGWIRRAIELAASPTGLPPEMLPGDAVGAVMRTIELELQVGRFEETSDGYGEVMSAMDQLLAAVADDDELALDVIDLLVRLLAEHPTARLCSQTIEQLEQTLASGQSAWAVGVRGEHRGLVPRVDPTVDARAAGEITSDRNASIYLGRAWAELRSRHPNFDLALDHANKALEAAAKPIVSPNNSRATLGTIIRDLEAGPDNWTCTLGTVEQVIIRLRDVWRAQYRHGLDDSEPMRGVDPLVAEAAIHDAITLVHWFIVGIVRRVS